jgi:hypothetical protein
MPRYFMHLRDSTDELLDPEGIYLPPGAVEGTALLAARDCIAHDVRSGCLDLQFRIDVHGEDGEIVHTVSFVDAVKIAPPR